MPNVHVIRPDDVQKRTEYVSPVASDRFDLDTLQFPQIWAFCVTKGRVNSQGSFLDGPSGNLTA